MNRRDLFKSVPAFAGALAVPLPSSAAGGDKARLRSAICAYSYRTALGKKTMTYDDLVRLAVDLDIDGLDLTVYWFPNTSDDFLLPLKRLAYKSAVEIYSISVRTEMTQATPELQAKELAGLKGWVDVAEKLGASHIRVFGGRVPKGATEEQAAGWVVETLKRGAEYAAKMGVILGLENHGGITEKADTLIKIVKAVDSPWVGINVDTGNFNRNGYAQLEQCVPYAVNVQVKIDVRDENGKAQPQDWDRVIQMLLKAHYRGYLALEFEGKDERDTPALLRKLSALVRKYSQA